MRATHLMLLTILLTIGSIVAAAGASTQEAPPNTTTQPASDTAGVDRLREALQEAYNRGDTAELLQYLHPEVVIIFPDGEILQGPQSLVDYMQRMLEGPDAIVESYETSPKVERRFIHDDTVVSFGFMNDHYVLTDGTEFGLDSRFTVTAIRLPQGPEATGGWVIRSFHSSTDAFDNPVLGIAVRRTAWYAGAGGLLVGLLVGALAAWLLTRRTMKSV